MNAITIPDIGAYFWANQCRFHIQAHDGILQVRCVENAMGGFGIIHTHMPASNVINLEVK